MKNTFSNLLARLFAVLLVTLGNTLPAEATVLSIDPSSLNVTVGQTFTLDIKISGASDLYNFQFDLGFDPTVLSANSIVEGGFLAQGGPTLYIDGTIDNTGGTISNTANSLQSAISGVGGDGVLATASFTAIAAGHSGISLFNTILQDSNLTDVAIDYTQNGSVTVTAAVPEPEEYGMMLLGFGLIGYQLKRKQRKIAAVPIA